MRKYIVLFFLIQLPFISCSQQNKIVEALKRPIIGTWGDQNDGTFKNPVLNSNYPDSDVEKFGDKWYMISSKGTYMKGMTILESSDLVNWSIIGGIVDSIDWDSERGVWAGDLVRHNDLWYCYFIDIDKGLFVSESQNIRGPWSKPKLILEKTGMTDPAVYFDDEEHKAYLICNYRIEDIGNQRAYHNRLFQLSWDGRTLLDHGRDIYVEYGAEAVKIYKVNDWFYLFFSEWKTNEQGKKIDRRQVVLRSKHIDGPYEKKVLLEMDQRTGRSASQGALVQAPDSTWWYFHQLVQKQNTYEGRPQCLIPVKWVNEWPVLGHDPDGNGIGNTVWHLTKPIQGKPLAAPQTDDDFEDEELSPQWLWDGNPLNHLWSLTDAKGYLRLYAGKPKNQQQKYTTLPNKLLQRKMGKGVDTVTVRMKYTHMENGNSSGLIITGFNLAAFGVEKIENNTKLFIESEDEKRYISFDNTKEWIYFRAIMNKREVKFEYSTNGRDYISDGKRFQLETRGFNGLFIGLFSMTESHSGGYVDFDWFSYRYDGPKSHQLKE